MLCGPNVHDHASDCERSRSICSRISAGPLRASSTPVPNRNTSGSSANIAIAAPASRLPAASTIRASSSFTSASVRGSGRMRRIDLNRESKARRREAAVRSTTRSARPAQRRAGACS